MSPILSPVLPVLKLLGFLAVEYVLFVVIGPAVFERPSPRPWVNDFVYPAAVTLLVTGGGAGALYLMAAPLWLVVLGFVIMLACSAFAALAGRFLRSSILSAAFALMFTYAAVLIAFLVAWNPPA